MILNDSHLFSNSADITTKEILKRYGGRARAPQVNSPYFNTAKTDSYGDASSPVPQSSSPYGGPVAQRVDPDSNVAVAWQSESSVRHVGSDLQNQIHPGMADRGVSERGVAGGMATPPNLLYSNSNNPSRNSSESHGNGNGNGGGGSPSRASMRSSAWDKQRAVGMA
jgi:hypothetical protein